MAGQIILSANQAPSPDTGDITFSLSYDDQLKASALVGTNTSQVTQQTCRIVGFMPDGSTEDPNKTFGIILPANSADQVQIPANGAKSIQLVLNTKGKVSGFNTYID